MPGATAALIVDVTAKNAAAIVTLLPLRAIQFSGKIWRTIRSVN
jgi:hypothetical protein